MNKIYIGNNKRNYIEFNWLMTKDGLIIAVTGGEEPHVGAVALALPRLNRDKDRVTCETFEIPVPGHKDIILASKVAKAVCVELNMPVSVTAGFHIDNATKEEIMNIEKSCDVLTKKLLNALQKKNL